MDKKECGVIILGGGPAGLTAAIYASRAGMDTILIEENALGGQPVTTDTICNYPGTDKVISGQHLMENIIAQAVSSGTWIDDLTEVLELDIDGETKYVKTDEYEYFGKAVIIATGAVPRSLTAEGADEFMGNGVHYCAICDGSVYKGLNVAVVGGGSSAVEESLYLANIAEHVTIIHRSETFRAGRDMLEKAYTNKKIDFITNTVIEKVKGKGDALEKLVLRNVNTGELCELKVDGLFVYIGYEPMTRLFRDKLQMDEMGYIIAGEDTKTNLGGVFAAGDVRTKSVRQIVTAAADGAVAGLMAEKYVSRKV